VGHTAILYGAYSIYRKEEKEGTTMEKEKEAGNTEGRV
jgi:hypothetical protein